MFDASTFLNQTVSGPMSTSVPSADEGEYTALVAGDDKYIEFREVETKNGTRPICRVWYEITDAAQKAKLGRETVRIPQDIWLDLDAGGNLDMGEGKNVRLGQLREALGQNEDTAWTFGKLRGAGPVMVRVSQRSDKNDPKTKYSEVQRVTRIS